MPKSFFIIPFIFLSLFSNGQTAGFTYTTADGLLCSPVTVQFSQTCTGNPTSFIWNFGNGQGSNAANPSIVFTTPGTYIVKLIAVFNTQAIETSQSLVINPGISATLTADRNYICTPGIINFTAGSTGNIATYEWNFGDGSPVATTTGPAISHNYISFGNFTSTVKAIDISGCSASNSYNITLQNPPISATVSSVEGCIPATVNFSAAPIIPTGSSVTNYSWTFGDGSPVVNTLSNNTSHTYTAVGTYIAGVSVTTNEGCSNSFTYNPIAFGTPPVNLVTYPDKLMYCGSETPVFVSKATNANSYFWDFGDGSTAIATDTITQHYYTTLGTKTITVTPYYNGCIGAGQSFQIDIIGVIAGFTFSNTCNNKNSFSFINMSQGNATSYLWNFGDGSPSASTPNAVHTYNNPGSYIASLTIADNGTGCSHTFSVNLYTGNSILTNPDTSICRNAQTLFTLSNNQTNASATYTWNIVGLTSGPSPNKTIQIPATLLGNFSSNYVIINNGPSYCLDTVNLNHAISVRGPNLSFNAPSTICQNSKYNLVNTSSAFNPSDSVVLWYWNYGIIPNNDSVFQPPPISYSGPAAYTIKLVAKDKTGCIDSLSKTLIVNPIPFIQIIPLNDTLCFGQTDTLIAFHSDTLLWSPAGAVSCATCDTVLINPATTTSFIATVHNTYNCMVSDTTVVTVFNPFTAQANASPIQICSNDTVRINVGPPGKIITWTPPAGLSSSNTYNPLASPVSNTTYIATLTDSAGCFSSTASIDVIVKSLPIVNAGPDKILPYNSTFTINPVYSNNIASYLWTPTGTLNCNNCPNPGGIALQAQTYIINVTSDSSCTARDTINILVECKYSNLFMPSAFTPNNDAKNDVYFPLTRGISTIKRFAIFNRLGQLIFEVKNFKPNDKAWGWDGKFKGQDQSPDTYVFFLEAICDMGGTITKKDSFILIR
jgi:gliding motility-associated-like protein